jgi:hypothetical protein
MSYFQTTTATAILVLMAGAAIAGPYDGIFRPAGAGFSNWSCKARDVGMDGGALAIRDGYFEGVESKCALTDPRPVSGEEMTTYTVLCSAEGEEYSYNMAIGRTGNGVRIEQESGGMDLVYCPGSGPQDQADDSGGRWSYGEGAASVVAGRSAFAVLCRRDDQGRPGYPGAQLIGPCPECAEGDYKYLRLEVDGADSWEFDFDKAGQGNGWTSNLTGVPTWDQDLVPALKAGSALAIFDGTRQIARFGLKGSGAALAKLRAVCE